MFIIYSNIDEVFVTTKELEPLFIENMTKKWKYNLDPNAGVFDRKEVSYNEACIRIISRRGYSID